MTPVDCRIDVRRRTARWDPDADVTAAEAMDFWAFTAGAANVVMQLSWPEVGYGVAESKVDSGNLLKHPWKRARTTFQYLAVAILGGPDDRAAFREAVDSSHRHVKSTADSPVRYNAFDRDLQMWVAACLFVGLEDTYRLLRGEMTADQAEQFYRSAWSLGTTLQVTEDQWPPTRADFDIYWKDACLRVAIDDRVRAYLQDLLNLRMINPVLALPFRPLLKFPHHRVPGAGLPGRDGCAVERLQAAPVRAVVPTGRLRQPVPAGVHPPRRQLPAAGRRAQAGPRSPSAGVRPCFVVC